MNNILWLYTAEVDDDRWPTTQFNFPSRITLIFFKQHMLNVGTSLTQICYDEVMAPKKRSFISLPVGRLRQNTNWQWRYVSIGTLKRMRIMSRKLVVQPACQIHYSSSQRAFWSVGTSSLRTLQSEKEWATACAIFTEELIARGTSTQLQRKRAQLKGWNPPQTPTSILATTKELTKPTIGSGAVQRGELSSAQAIL